MKENEITKQIMAYIRDQGGYCQRLNSGMAFKMYGGKKYAMMLCDKGTPDIIACMPNIGFIGCEVKKDKKAVKAWLRLQKRHLEGETLPKSYGRELAQFQQAEKIIKACGKYIITHSLEDFKNDL